MILPCYTCWYCHNFIGRWVHGFTYLHYGVLIYIVLALWYGVLIYMCGHGFVQLALYCYANSGEKIHTTLLGSWFYFKWLFIIHKATQISANCNKIAKHTYHSNSSIDKLKPFTQTYNIQSLVTSQGKRSSIMWNRWIIMTYSKG